MKKVTNAIKLIIDIFCWVLIGVLVVSIIFSVIAHYTGTIPSAFGYTICRVSSGSMEPQLEVGDVILGKKVYEPENLKVGDVVTYKGSGILEGEFITHMVIVEPHTEDGVLMLQTKGIANEIPDSPIKADDVVSVMLREVGFLKYFYDFFLSPWGLLTIVFLIIIVFIDEVISLIRNLSGEPKSVKNIDIDDIISRVKEETASENNTDAEDK